MTRSMLQSLIALCSLLSLGSSLAISASPPTLIANSIETPSSNPTGWTWLWMSSDGSQIVPISGPPALAKFLFEGEFGLFGQVPESAPGVWTPYPNAAYGCYGDPGVLRMNRVEQSTGWLMAYHDLAFLIKVLHDTQGVKDEAPWFNFKFGWLNQTGVYPHVPIVNGKWDQTYSGAAATSAH